MIATQPFVQETFDRFNALCFGGLLPPVPVVMVRASSFLGKMEFKIHRSFFGRTLRYTDFRMRISTSYDLPQEMLEDVVIHEMIHYYLAWKNIKDTSAHGRVFRAMMASINGKHGRHITISYRLPKVQNPL